MKSWPTVFATKTTMATKKYGVALVALCISLRGGESTPASTNGCSCTSACGKSWHNSGDEWCYVGKQCEAAGWDSCHNDVNLNNKITLTEDKPAESPSLKDELAEDLSIGGISRQAFNHLSNGWQKLKRQLKQTMTKEVQYEARLKATQKLLDQEKERRIVGEASLTNTESKLKDAQQHSSEQEQQIRGIQKQLRDVSKHEADEEAELTKARVQLKTSEVMEDTLKKQLKSALEKESEAELRAKTSEKKEQQISQTIAQKQAEAAKAVQEAQEKARKATEEAQAKEKEEHFKAAAWEVKYHKDLVEHTGRAMELSNSQLKLSRQEKEQAKTTKKVKEISAKFKVMEKDMLKVKAKASENEKKLSASVKEATQLKDAQKKYIDTQKKLKVAEAERNQAYAELKPFHEALRKAVLA